MEFVFERTGDAALAQAYRILVPERRSRADHSSGWRRDGNPSNRLLPVPGGGGALPAVVDPLENAHVTVAEQVEAGA